MRLRASICRITVRFLLMDRTDRAIVAQLEDDGRQTITELARRVSLTPAPCQRRLRDLEARGVIRGYHADVDASALGVGFEVVVSVTMDREDAATIEAFETELSDIPEISRAERLFGEPDYLLRVVTADIAAYQRLRDEVLATLPGVQRLTSTIVMRTIVGRRTLASIPPR
jgi:DNA-binding Lrp family transcriptional regulator